MKKPRQQKASPAQIKQARDLYASDDIQIDDDAKVSIGRNTHDVWVQAWVFVQYQEKE